MGDKLIVRHHGEGEALWMLGGLYEVKAASDETNGQLTVMELTIPEGAGPPPHIHSTGEAVYVIEGKLRYRIGDDTIEAKAGDFFYFPAGTIETFEPIGTVRVLLCYTPGGLDKFFEEYADKATSRTVPKQAGAPDVERLTKLADKHGLQLVLK